MVIIFMDWYAYHTLIYMFLQGKNPYGVIRYSLAAMSFLPVSACKKLLITLSFSQEADKYLCKSWSLNSIVRSMINPKQICSM